jgi:hypothetical protein
VSGNRTNIDAVLLEKTTKLNPYFDGTYADPVSGYAITAQGWTGTTNNSTSTITLTSVSRFLFSVEYFNSGSWISLPNPQGIDWNWGRRTITEPRSSSQATITGRCGNSFPVLRVGMLVQFKIEDNIKGGTSIFGGQLADLVISYGKVVNEDQYTITVEGPFARAGRYIDDFVLTAGQSTDVAWENYEETLPPPGQIGVLIAGTIQNVPGLSTSTVSGYTANTSLAEIFNLIADTEVGRIIERQDHDALDQDIDLQLRQNLQQLPISSFSDVPANWGSAYKYDSLEFRALSDAYADRVEIDPDGLPVSAAGTGTRTQRFRSVDQTTLQAQAHAEYVLNLLAALGDVPYLIRCSAITQDEDDLLDYFSQAVNGYKINVAFRSTTYAAIIEGGFASATPDNVVGTLYLSAQDQNAYLILDDTTYGKLDENKLGF